MKTLSINFMLISIFLMVGIEFSFSQEKDNKNAYVLGFLPSKKDNIYGFAIGLIGSEAYCSVDSKRKSHGINLQLFGNGGFILMTKQFWNQKGFAADSVFEIGLSNEQYFKTTHNGLIFSTFGTNTSKTNGIAISCLVSNGMIMNGIGLNLVSNNYLKSNGVFISIFNQSYRTNGIQIGLINKSKYIKGIQIGLWNVNSKRKLPLINWGF